MSYIVHMFYISTIGLLFEKLNILWFSRFENNRSPAVSPNISILNTRTNYYILIDTWEYRTKWRVIYFVVSLLRITAQIVLFRCYQNATINDIKFFFTNFIGT